MREGGSGVEGEKRVYLAALPCGIEVRLTGRAIASSPLGIGNVGWLVGGRGRLILGFGFREDMEIYHTNPVS